MAAASNARQARLSGVGLVVLIGILGFVAMRAPGQYSMAQATRRI
jgi:hypothetical protein